MRFFNCSECGFHITEADKVWDEYTTTNKCPNCELIKVGYVSSSKSGRDFVGLKTIRKNRIIAGLFIVILAILFLAKPITFQSGRRSSLLGMLQTVIGNEGLALLVLILGANFIYSGFKK